MCHLVSLYTLKICRCSFAGRSRSATVVLAYLMRKFDMTLDDTMTMVMKHRNVWYGFPVTLRCGPFMITYYRHLTIYVRE